MRILTFKKINKFIKKHANSDASLKDWYFKTKRNEWDKLTDIKQTFNNVYYVGNNRYVFNIKKGSYRLVAIIIFDSKKVYIRYIGTHADYDKIDCKNI